MLSKLRGILLTQYIGAILTAIVAAQGVQTLLSLTLSFIWRLVAVWRTPAGVLGESQYQDFDWARTIYSLVSILLNAAVVYGLMRWLYFGRQDSALQQGAEIATAAPETPSQSS
jgi:hypothetical protein